jgi:hypothetical protein
MPECPGCGGYNVKWIQADWIQADRLAVGVGWFFCFDCQEEWAPEELDGQQPDESDYSMAPNPPAEGQ